MIIIKRNKRKVTIFIRFRFLNGFCLEKPILQQAANSITKTAENRKRRRYKTRAAC